MFSSNYKNKEKLKQINRFELLDHIYKALFRKEAAMNNIDISQTRGYNELDGAMSSIRKQWLGSIPFKERLTGLAPEKILMGLAPEKREKLREILFDD